ncbi:MAG TPA: AAA family ATPase [Tepidisphaeraceae bacterium]|jgi:ABC-type ATPase with predicted acetyltransferase domain|nr:AAA family ATPase [Tepidisphaeraceae bacterium]
MKSARLTTLARWFCIPERHAIRTPEIDERILRTIGRLARAGKIVLVTGPSGSGKSCLVRAIRDRLTKRRTLVDVDSIALATVPLVECFAKTSLDETLSILSRIGLAEAWSYFRTPQQLSEGQRWRVKLALAVEQVRDDADSVLIADEFAAVLDRVTAAVVARSVRRTIDAHQGVCAIVATSHDDLAGALEPDLMVRCDFGRISMVHRYNERFRD